MGLRTMFNGKIIAMMTSLFTGLAVGAPTNDPISRSIPNGTTDQWNSTHPPTEIEAFGGDLTWYNTGVGACGWFNNPGDAVCAVSHVVYDRSNIDGNPNHNLLCGRRIHLQRGGSGIDVTVADRCEGCREFDIDVTRGVFQRLGDVDEGRVRIDWWWI